MKYLITVFFLLFTSLSWAQVNVEVVPAQVSVGEQFKLVLSQQNVQSTSVPDLSALQQDFMILGTERSVNYSVINGQAQSNNQWIVILQAKRAGIFTIPAIQLGKEQTNPVTINIENNGKPIDSLKNADQQPGVFLTAAVDQKKPYVNQQVIYTVRLYNSKHLLNADYQGPQVEDALLIPLGDANRYLTL
jgi:hypothetical protein